MGSPTRRQVIRSSLALAGGAALAPWPSVAAAARPTRTAAKIRLLVSIGYQGNGNYGGVMQELVEDYIAAHWLPAHPGVAVSTMAGVASNGNSVTAGAQIAASLSGTGADVITGDEGSWYEDRIADLLLPLDTYLRQDNVDLHDFSPGHLKMLTTPDGILGLPEYDGPMVMAVNLGILDDLGLPYPSQDWTYEQAQDLFTKAAGLRKGQHVTGASLFTGDWWPHAWGGAVGNAAGTRCLLDSPPSVAAYTWFADLVERGIAELGDNLPTTSAFAMQGGWDIQGDLEGLEGLKWQYYPAPIYPAGRDTYINSDFYAINRYSKHPPELLWDIFKFIVLDTGFQQLLYKTTLVTPNRPSLWADWYPLIYTVAPGLADKNLQAYGGAVGYGTAQYFFEYQDGLANSLRDTYWQEVLDRRISVPLAMQVLTARINALQAAGAAQDAGEAASDSDASREVAEAEAGTRAAFTPPASAGMGLPPTAAPTLVTASRGALTVVGAGAGLSSQQDDGTFFCAAASQLRATFSCRITAVATVDERPVDPNAAFGLMLRGDLSDDAPMAGIFLSAAQGVFVEARPVPEVDVETPPAVGNPAALLRPYATASGAPIAQANYLTAPLWLRIVRDIDQFSFAMSSDGSTWVPAAPPFQASLAGLWAGLLVTSNQPGRRVKAVFDQLVGFAPNRAWALGG